MSTITNTSLRTATVLIVAGTFVSCENPLQEETFSTLGPTNFFQSAEDAEALLNAAYANSQGYRDILRDYLTFGEMTTEIMIERQGAINALTQPIEDFRIESTHPWLEGLWARYYSAIFRSNVVLDNVPGIDMNVARREQILAEARFLRAFNYFYLYDLWGPVPILETSETSVTDRPTRPTDGEFVAFLEGEFQSVADVLPATPTQFGRATSGAALGLLTKFYLNNKKWSEAAATAQEIIQSGQYSIFNTGNRTDLFALENARTNNEFIYVVHFPDNPTGGLGNTYLSHTAPSGYQWTWPPKVIFAANFKIRSAFLETFEPEDERLDAFVFEYVNTSGDTIQLGQDDVRSFKYPEDPNGVGDVSGNDVPLVRYADILLSRAEALNELNGPSQESIDLINEVREAAGVDPITLAGFSQATLRDFILEERGREFHTEALRRQDLIRHGVFIQRAIQRGKQALDHHVVYPIPQSEIDRNPELEQNEGY